MRPLLCSDPLSPRQPDEAYRAEVAAAERLGVPFALVNHDALARENDPVRAVRRVAVRLAQRPLGCGSFNPSDTLGHRTKRNPGPCQPPATSPS
jgi:hypothetical protein